MKITDGEIKTRDDQIEVSAHVDGFRLWYRVPKIYSVNRAAEPFLAAALLPAMIRGEALEIDSRLTVSPKLLRNLALLQEIHHCWNPAFKIIPIEAATSPSSVLNSGSISFFSGGVDSMYTLLKSLREIDYLVFIQGFDFYYNKQTAKDFSVADIADLSQLSYKLATSHDAVSSFIRTRLSENTLQILSVYQESGLYAKALEECLARELNGIVSGPSIYHSGLFSGVTLRSDTKLLLEENPNGRDTLSLNRGLLEDAYPLEIAKRNSKIYEMAVNRNKSFGLSLGKTLIPVETNHFAFGYRYNLSRNLTQGSALASIALLLGFVRTYVPAAYSYNQLIPLGSHPLTDPLWSSEGTQIFHDGAEARRVDKIKAILLNKPALENLRVCFNDMNINCGKCAKCLRTMIPLYLLDAVPAPFPPLPPPSAIRRMRIGGNIEMIFFKENYELAVERSNLKLRNALKACMKRYDRTQLFKEVDQVLLGGLIKRAKRNIIKRQSGYHRIDTTPSVL